MSLNLQPSNAADKMGEATSVDQVDDYKPSLNNDDATNIESDDPKNGNTSTTSSVGKKVEAGEVIKFPTDCPNCHEPTETNMCITNIPHFKEVIIMSLNCDCGYKSNEVKCGGAITAFGTKITLSVNDCRDLAREVLKSDTAGIEIPEVELVLGEGGLECSYTTVEGLLRKMRDRLAIARPFPMGGASATFKEQCDKSEYVKFDEFLAKMNEMAEGNVFPFTLIVSDPLSNSFVGPTPEMAIALSRQAEEEGSTKCYDDFVDEGMVIEEYERTPEQSEELGLTHMKTEGYQRDESGGKGYYFGTDQMEDLPERLRNNTQREPDHPSEADSAVFAVPAMHQRGKQVAKDSDGD